MDHRATEPHRRWLLGCFLVWLGSTVELQAQVSTQPAPQLPSHPPMQVSAQPMLGDADDPNRRDADPARPPSPPESRVSAPVADVTTRLTPTQQLERMATALASTEFEGTLVYLHGVHLAALRVTHRLEQGESRESLFALSGPVRALARNGQGVTCVLPNARPIQVRRGAGSVLRSPALDPNRLSEHYLIEALGHSRVAGRDTDVIGIIPRDDLRYGYRYFIDRATGLPLKTDLMDNAAEPIEQVMFTEIDLILPNSPLSNSSPTRQSASPAANPARNTPGQPPPKTANGATTASPAQPSDSVAPSRWRFDRLPPGFEVVGQGLDAVGAPSTDGEFFLLSDGLASVSVTIDTGTDRGFNGTRQLGAAHATGMRRDGYQITAVGEVPAATVQAILDGLVRR